MITNFITQKKMNPDQLFAELKAAGVDPTTVVLHSPPAVAQSIQPDSTMLGSFTAQNAGDVAAIQTVIANHVPMRQQTNAEYRAEYPTATVARQTTIRQILIGLQNRDLVPL